MNFATFLTAFSSLVFTENHTIKYDIENNQKRNRVIDVLKIIHRFAVKI